jgi:hypothetical protein
MIWQVAATCNLAGGQQHFQATQYCQLHGHLTLTAKGQLLTMPLHFPIGLESSAVTTLPVTLFPKPGYILTQ